MGAMSDSPYVEIDDGYVAPSFQGVGIGRVALDYQVTLHIGSDSVVIESPFAVIDGDESTVNVPGDPSNLETVASLLHAVCTRLEMKHSGHLVITLADSRRLAIDPSEDFEAWQVFVRGSNMVVCTPGGNLSFF
jgi:hypothetical protein